METVIIEQTEWLPAKPAQVYDAFANARKHAEFTGAGATCEPAVGGAFSAWDGYISGTNLELELGRPSRIEFRFAPKNDGTEVTMVHSSVPVDYYWTPLKRYFAKA
jgi:uncharacterized protein YndB with AHSA1/START domain